MKQQSCIFTGIEPRYCHTSQPFCYHMIFHIPLEPRELRLFIRVKVEKNTFTPYFAGSSLLSNLFEEDCVYGNFKEKYHNCTVSKVILMIFI